MSKLEALRVEVARCKPDAPIHPEMFSTYGLLKAGDVMWLLKAAGLLTRYLDAPWYRHYMSPLPEFLRRYEE